jgi:predicted amidohydrolase
MHWRQLLLARAIENLACVIGVNRTGSDASGLHYSGDSLAVSQDGELLKDLNNENGAVRVVLNGAALQAYRESFPCQLDADRFQLE